MELSDEALAQVTGGEMDMDMDMIRDKLPLGFQEIFQLRFIDDLSYRDIAARLNISEVLARKRCHLIRGLMKNIVGAGG